MVLKKDPDHLPKVLGGCGAAALRNFTVSAENLLRVVAAMQKENKSL
jgi:hypothetical protein